MSVPVYGEGTINLESGGAVFKIDTAGHETVLYAFPECIYPREGLARDAAGNLYGTTYEGGKTTCYGTPAAAWCANWILPDMR